MRRATAWLSAVALVVGGAGCASTTEDDAAARKPLVLAVVAAPCVGAVTSAAGPDGKPVEGMRAEDALLDLVTALSTETDVAYVLVPGPLLAPRGDDPAGDLAALGGALGSLSAPAVVALAPSDVETEGGLEPLLEGLERDLPGHPGKAAYLAKRRPGFRVLALGPDGKGPEAEAVEEKDQDEPDDDAWTIAALGAAWGSGEGTQPVPQVDLLVAVGAQPTLTAGAGGRLTLLLPPFVDPPHVWALVTIQEGQVRVSVRALDPATKARDLPPLALTDR